MGKSIPAIVTPEVLTWARNLDQITVEEIAKKLKTDASKVEAWERGEVYPTLPQAKAFAKQCRIPFVYLYLPDTPRKEKRLEKVDYRTFGNGTITTTSRELKWLLRDIEERRDAMIGLYKEAEYDAVPLSLSIPIGTTKEQFAEAIREYLSLSDAIQTKQRKPEKLLSYCISVLEDKDYLVFQAAGIQPNEMRGLSVAYDVFPIIVLNRKDEQSARLFTLIHELVHILSRTSGICNDMGREKENVNQLEFFCNEVAGLTLVPTKQLVENPYYAQLKTYGFDDYYVSALARDFAVSREVIIHRLWDLQDITQRQYYEVLNRYTEEYKVYKKQKIDGFLPPALDKGTQVGKLFSKTVLSAYHSDRLSPREASNYLLGLGVKHFGAVERWCF